MQLLGPLSPDGVLLTVGVVADLAVGDPVYAWHPVRLIGRMLTWMEGCLRDRRLDGYGGGVLLFIGLATVSLAVVSTTLFIASTAVSGVRLAASCASALQSAGPR